MLKRHDLIEEQYAKKFGAGWLPRDKSTKKARPIKEIPFMITEDGTVVCIPKLPDMGLISAIGLPGSGKSLVCGYIIDGIFWSWKDYVALLNDVQDEAKTWSEPCDNNDFIQKLRKLNQSPMPLPMIYLYPNSDKFEIPEEQMKDKNYTIISVPFIEVIKNIEKYLPSLGNSLKYLMERKEDLEEIETEEELFEIIDAIDTGTKGMAEVKRKIASSFQNLLNEKIINLSDPTIPSKLSVGKDGKLLNPFTAIMKTQCIPAFITIGLRNQPYRDAIYSYYINAIFDESLEGGAMKGKRVWLYFEELTRVISSDPKDTLPETEKALKNIAARARNNEIGMIYATQRYMEIPKPIREQTKYAIVFKHKSADETKEIQEDFGVGKKIRNEILKLRKFQAIALTTEYFVCYKGNKRWETKEEIKGEIIPPLHKNRFLHR